MSGLDRLYLVLMLVLTGSGAIVAYRSLYPAASPPPVVIQSPPPAAPTAAPSPAPPQAAPAPQPIVIIIRDTPPAGAEPAPRRVAHKTGARAKRVAPSPPPHPLPRRPNQFDYARAQLYAWSTR